ncbi:class II histone deacetylase [Pseudomaricurvus alkylphenolicus]|uniref:class II histone deacetylase n=1 Tax=Pseudomaricurvus alkylphenolicus TaxID=1306991 RepID=UPI00141D77EF|nr:class II histone deacetylase [Pseudomaricurvus alkylphenolicus]NIB40185.1 class II histone deacetylase [Pseudomaricurvus alkylphenolicus]
MKTGFVWHESYAWHDTGSHAALIPADGKTVQPDTHGEDPETKRRFRNLLEMSGLWDELQQIKPRMATEEDVLRFHTRDYLERVKHLSANGGGEAGPLTVCAPGSYEIALRSTGGVLAAMDAVLNGDVNNAYALVRPPGHHAMPDEGQGFCLFGNAAIAGKVALAERGLERVAFVDWDVHHGNGTEAAFWSDSRGLTISIHQDRFFPADRGLIHQMGEGDGEGYNINLPMPPGSGVGAYVAAFERVVVPALRRYKPELIVVPSGFDAGAMDPFGRNMMHSDGYRQLTRMLMAVADEVCDGRLLMCHEGGYSRATVPFYGLAVMEELSGIDTGVADPFLEMVSGFAGQELQPHQEQVIENARELVYRVG